jgi:16S rRNA (cytidine1402-2'-O)-methyltransferase
MRNAVRQDRVFNFFQYSQCDIIQAMSTLYVVPTPIGNLEDITLRALRILKEVNLILCEDTSVTHKLLKHYGIETKTSNFFAQSSESKLNKVIEMLEDDKTIALVSDAGTPTLSDPGVILVDAARKKGIDVVALPGASALVTALASSGISSAEFTFLGFLPHKKGRETLFKEIAGSTHTVAFYESVHRIEKTLASLVEVLGDERRVAVCRELSKLHEEVVRGTAKEVRGYFVEHQDKVRGEFVVVVEGK